MKSVLFEILLTIVAAVITVVLENKITEAGKNRMNMRHITQISLSPYTRLQNDLIFTASWSILVSLVLLLVYKLFLMGYFESKKYDLSTVGSIIYTISAVVVLFVSPLLWDLVKYQDNRGKRVIWIELRYLMLGT